MLDRGVNRWIERKIIDEVEVLEPFRIGLKLYNPVGYHVDDCNPVIIPELGEAS